MKKGHPQTTLHFIEEKLLYIICRTERDIYYLEKFNWIIILLKIKERRSTTKSQVLLITFILPQTALHFIKRDL